MARPGYKHIDRRPPPPRRTTALVLERPQVVDDDELRGLDTSASYAACVCTSASSSTLYFRVHAEDLDLLSETFNPLMQMPYELIAAIRYVKTVLQAGGPVCTFEAHMRRQKSMECVDMWLLCFTTKCRYRASQRPPV